MKTKLLALFAFCLISAAAMAQFHLGVKAGANINARNDTGYTALMFAIQYQQSEVVQILIESKADVNAKNNYGYSAMAIAKNIGNARIIELLKQAGAKEI